MAKIKLNGDTSGYIEISAPAVSGNNTLELGPGTKILTNLDNTFTGVSTFTSGLHVTGGSFGLGTDNPALRAHIYSTAATDAALIESTQNYATLRFKSALNTSGPTIGIDGAGGLQLDQKDTSKYISFAIGSERLRIDSSGRLLKSGQAALTSTSISHPIQVASASDANAIAIFGRAADDIGELSFYEADKSTKLGELQYRQDHVNFRCRVGDIRFASGGTSETLRIDGAGRIAQGGKTPTNHGSPNLLLWGADPTLHISATGSTANTSFAGIKFAVAGGSTGDYSKAGIFVQRQDSYNDLDMIFAFRSSNDATGVSVSDEKIRINSDGNLSLGTTVSNERVNIHTASSLKAQVQFTNNTTGTGGGDGLVIGITGGEDSIFWNQENTNILFATNNTERLRITSAGKLGIGVQSPFSRFQSGGHTFNGGNGMHSNDRVGMSNHGQLTGLMLASTYNDGAHPEYGLVFVQGPNTSSYNVWSVSPDGPAKGNSLNFHYDDQATNIHSPGYRKFQMTGEGYFLQPHQPKFRAGRSSNYSPGAGSDIIFNTVSGGGKHNVGGHYNTSNGRFTAPVAGVYTFTIHVIWMNLSSGQNMADCFHPKINGVVQGYSGRRGEYIANETGNAGYYTDFMTYQFSLAANDYVTVNNQFNLTIHGNSNYTTFSGHLVG